MSDVISNINSNYIGGDILDGQWVAFDDFLLFSGNVGAYTSSSSVKVMSLDEVLPKDGHTYLCQIQVAGATGTTSGNTFTSIIIPGSINYEYSGNASCLDSGLSLTVAQRVKTRSSSSRLCAGWLYVPVYPEDRNITMINTNQANNSSYPVGVVLKKFRRLGTNR